MGVHSCKMNELETKGSDPVGVETHGRSGTYSELWSGTRKGDTPTGVSGDTP